MISGYPTDESLVAMLQRCKERAQTDLATLLDWCKYNNYDSTCIKEVELLREEISRYSAAERQLCSKYR